jgi:hypothetical protein
MKKALKILKKVLIGFGILLLVIMIGGYIAIKVVVTKDFVATKIEENINGRVEIKDISVPIWAAFSGITVDGFKIGYRDGEVGKPMATRTPMKDSVIGFKKFNFQVALGALITSFGKNFELKSLLFTEPTAHIVLGKNGGNNLEPLLKKPKTKEDLAKEAAEAAEKKAAPVEAAKKPFDIREIPTVIKMGKVGMEGGFFTVTIESIGQTLKISSARAVLRDILIDPKDLEHKNQVGLSAGFDLELQGQGGGVKSLKISYDLSGGLTPFNPKTGGPAEAMTLKMGLLKGSYVTGLAIFDKLKNQTAMLNKAGIKLNFLQETQTLAKDAYATINYGGGVVTLAEPPALVTGDFEFRLTKGDYINIKSMDHHFRGDLALAERHTKTIESELDKNINIAVEPAVGAIPAGAIRDQVKVALAPEKIRASILAPAMKNGLITIGVDSSGSVSSPNVRVVRPEFPDMKSMISNEIKKATGDLKGMVGAQVDALKNKAMDEGKKQVNAAKQKAEAEAKKAAADALKNNMPKIPGF